MIAAFLLFGSVGISIFSHTCEEEGLNISYFAPIEDICDDHGHEQHHANKAEDHHQTPCCDEKSEDDGCCSTSSEFVKVHLDFLNKVYVQAILVENQEVSPVWLASVPVPTDEISIASGSDPPPKLGQEILIDIQQWLI